MLMDRRTRRRIEKMDLSRRQVYVETVEQELQRAREKHRRLLFAFQRTPHTELRGFQKRRLNRLERQVKTLTQIIEYAQRTA